MSNDPENQELPYTDDGPTEDVEIEITEDDLGESLEDYEQQEEPEEEQPEEPEETAEQEEPEEEEAPKRRRSPEKRISELARKAAEAEQRAQALEARLQKESQLREQSEQAMMTHYRNNLSVTAMDLKQKLSEARSMMDNEKIDDLQYQFTKTMNDLEAVTNWEREQQNKAARPAEPEAAKPQQQQVTLEPRTASWIQKNTWFQPKSEDFDPEMHEEATLYARRVERRFRAEGRDDEIGSVDYFTEIDRHLRREFPDAFSAQATPSKRAPPMSRDSNAAPVQRSAPGQPAKTSTKLRLSADQRRMAHQMAQSGAYRNPNGSRMTDLEAEKYHAIYILKTNKGAQ